MRAYMFAAVTLALVAIVAADAGIAGQCGGFVKVESKYASLPVELGVGVALRGTQRGFCECVCLCAKSLGFQTSLCV